MKITKLSSVKFTDYTNQLLDQISGKGYQQYILKKYYLRKKIPLQLILDNLNIVILIAYCVYFYKLITGGVANLMYMWVSFFVGMVCIVVFDRLSTFAGAIEEDVDLAKRFRKLKNWNTRLQDVYNIRQYIVVEYIPQLYVIKAKLQKLIVYLKYDRKEYLTKLSNLQDESSVLKDSTLTNIHSLLGDKCNVVDIKLGKSLEIVQNAEADIEQFINELESDTFIVNKLIKQVEALKHMEELTKLLQEGATNVTELQYDLDFLQTMVVPQLTVIDGLNNVINAAIIENDKNKIYQEECLK